MRTTTIVTSLLTGTGLALIALPAAAQTAGNTPATAPSQASGDASGVVQPDAGIGDIIVTAQRREERLQSVPIAITAITGRGLEQAGIRDITRLEVLTPGLTVGQSGSDSRPALRGVNTDNSRQAGADATVAFFIDGIYQSSNQQALVGFTDLARVEVQRGPQGTLYGRNSFGGNIALFSNLPTDQLEGSLRGEYGSYNHYKIEGVINAPLAPDLDFRIAGYREKSDGYVHNITPGGTRAEDVDDYFVRPSLRWRASDRLEVILRGSAWIGNGAGGGAYEYKVEGIQVDGSGNQSITGTTVVPINPRAKQSDIATLPAAGVPVPTDPYTIAQDTPSTRRIRNYSGSGEINYDLDFATVKLLGSYTDFDAARTSDGDFTQYHVRFNLQESRNKTGTGEVQLASKSGSPFQYVVGAYYLSTDASEYFQQFRYTFNAFTDNILTRFGTESYAFFGQASYKLTDALRATAGIRYTNDRKSTSGVDFANPSVTGALPNVIPYSSTHFDKVTWRAALDYQVTPDKLLYASVNTGFRSGGFNTGVSIASIATFRPETVTAYEIGAKTRWLDNLLQINIAAFINDFHAIQINGYDGNTNLTYTQNVGNRTARGVEAEILIKPVPSLEIAFTGSYLDAHYRAGATAFDPISGNAISIAGNQSGFSPDYRIGAAVSYAVPLGNGATLTPRVQTSLVGQYYLTDFNAFIERQRPYSKTDLRLTYTAPNDRYTLEAFVTNLEDRAVKSGGEFGGRGAYFIGYAPPRLWGVAAGVKF